MVMMRNRRNRSKTDLETMESFRKFREAMKQLQEEPVTKSENNNVETFHTDEEHLKPVYAMANLIVAQQQAFVDVIHGKKEDQ